MLIWWIGSFYDTHMLSVAGAGTLPEVVPCLYSRPFSVLRLQPPDLARTSIFSTPPELTLNAECNYIFRKLQGRPWCPPDFILGPPAQGLLSGPHTRFP